MVYALFCIYCTMNSGTFYFNFCIIRRLSNVYNKGTCTNIWFMFCFYCTMNSGTSYFIFWIFQILIRVSNFGFIRRLSHVYEGIVQKYMVHALFLLYDGFSYLLCLNVWIKFMLHARIFGNSCSLWLNFNSIAITWR